MIKLFCGYEERESAGFHVFVHSVIKRASKPVSIIPLASMGLPVGSNAFSLSRFLVPYLCGFKGKAIFCDASDMLMLDDVAKLESAYVEGLAASVVKRDDYETVNPVKYVGTELECENLDYPRKNWASVIVFNCEHEAWKPFTPEMLSIVNLVKALDFTAMLPKLGSLSGRWNVLVDEGDDDTDAKLLHWTAGIPAFPHYQNARRSQDWFREFREMSGTKPDAARGL